MTVLIIASMHRSGSSLTAALLQRAGLHIGQRLMEATTANKKGHFEDLDIYELHKKILQSQEINTDGWVTKDLQKIEEYYFIEAQEIISKKSRISIWGWKEPRTTLFLDFWHKLLPDAKFLLIYRTPWDVIDSLYRRGDRIFHAQPELAYQIWLYYNHKILNFYNQFPSQCFLVNIQTIIKYEKSFLKALNKKFEIDLNLINSAIYDPHLLLHCSYNTSVLEQIYPEILLTYQNLNDLAWQPTEKYENQENSIQVERNSLNKSQESREHWNQLSQNSEIHFQKWYDSQNLPRQNKKLQQELEETKYELLRTQAHLHQLQEELQKNNISMNQFEEVLENYKKKLNQTEVILEQAQTQQRYTQYQLLVLQACVEYKNEHRLNMAQYLEQAWLCTPFSPIETITDWLQTLTQFCLHHDCNLDVYSLTNSPEWKKVMQQVIQSED